MSGSRIYSFFGNIGEESRSSPYVSKRFVDVSCSNIEYLRGESNSYLKFRKLLFYPLNYRGLSELTIYPCFRESPDSARDSPYSFTCKDMILFCNAQ